MQIHCGSAKANPGKASGVVIEDDEDRLILNYALRTGDTANNEKRDYSSFK